eukprot:g30697.t1
MKYTNKPLSWKYEASSAEGGMPTAEYKQHGDADPHWCGEGGVPGAPQLKAYLRPPAYCKAKGLAVGGKKADLLSRIWEHAATQVEAQEEESELDSQADDSDKVAEVLEGNALAGQSDLELSGSE